MSAGCDERVHKQVVLDFLLGLVRDYPKMDLEGAVGCFMEEFDYWPDELDEDERAELFASINGIFDDGPGAARSTDPITAQTAARKLGGTGSKKWRVFKYILDSGDHGATSHEIEKATGIDFRSLTPRIGELKRYGVVSTNGTSRMGGHKMAIEVLVVTPFGREALKEKGIA